MNGVDPLEFIQKINKGFKQCKSPQAQFVLNKNNMEQLSLSSYQFEKGDLIDITILYEDSTQLKYYYKMGFAKKTNKQFFNYFSEYFKPNQEMHLSIPEISKSFMKKNSLLMDTNAQINWDKEIFNNAAKSIKCRIDTNKGMNVIYQDSFLFDDYNGVVNFLAQCYIIFY